MPVIPTLQHLEIDHVEEAERSKQQLAAMEGLTCLVVHSDEDVNINKYFFNIPYKQLRKILTHLVLDRATPDDYPATVHALVLESQSRTDCGRHTAVAF